MTQLILGLSLGFGLLCLLDFVADKTPERRIEGVDLVKVVDFERYKPAKFNITPTQSIVFVCKDRCFYKFDLNVVYIDTEQEEPVTLNPSHTDNYRLYLSEASFKACKNQHEIWEQFLKSYKIQLENKSYKH